MPVVDATTQSVRKKKAQEIFGLEDPISRVFWHAEILAAAQQSVGRPRNSFERRQLQS